MIVKAVQQFMLGSVMNNEAQARDVLQKMKDAGYGGIELCGFMIHPTGFLVRMMTKAAGMPVGKGGKLDWKGIVKDSGLQVVSLHTDLGSVERDAANLAAEAKAFGTKYAVITGMYRFAYGDETTVHDLAARLNKAGEALKKDGIDLLYHNHNCELQRVSGDKRAYDILLEETDPAFINFEFDSYWFADGGADPLTWMEHQRPGEPAHRPGYDAHPEQRQHGAGHRQSAAGSAGPAGQGKRHRSGDPGEPPQLDRQIPGQEPGTEREVAQRAFLGREFHGAA